MVFGHFLLGSHNFTVMALGLCVKWPLLSESYDNFATRNIKCLIYVIGRPHSAVDKHLLEIDIKPNVH